MTLRQPGHLTNVEVLSLDTGVLGGPRTVSFRRPVGGDVFVTMDLVCYATGSVARTDPDHAHLPPDPVAVIHMEPAERQALRDRAAERDVYFDRLASSSESTTLTDMRG